MDRFFVHKDRHVVVATGDEVDGCLPVRRLGLHPQVQGSNRKGRPPKYAKPVPVGELVELTDEAVLAQVTSTTEPTA